MFFLKSLLQRYQASKVEVEEDELEREAFIPFHEVERAMDAPKHDAEFLERIMKNCKSYVAPKTIEEFLAEEGEIIT